MAQFLVVIDFPSTESATGYDVGVANRIEQFVALASHIVQQTSAESNLARNVLLLPAENSWQALLGLRAAADTCRFSYRVLLIEGAVTQVS